MIWAIDSCHFSIEKKKGFPMILFFFLGFPIFSRVLLELGREKIGSVQFRIATEREKNATSKFSDEVY